MPRKPSRIMLISLMLVLLMCSTASTTAFAQAPVVPPIVQQGDAVPIISSIAAVLIAFFSVWRSSIEGKKNQERIDAANVVNKAEAKTTAKAEAAAVSAATVVQVKNEVQPSLDKIAEQAVIIDGYKHEIATLQETVTDERRAHTRTQQSLSKTDELLRETRKAQERAEGRADELEKTLETIKNSIPELVSREVARATKPYLEQISLLTSRVMELTKRDEDNQTMILSLQALMQRNTARLEEVKRATDKLPPSDPAKPPAA
jgi:chromosome segregation ATPase